MRFWVYIPPNNRNVPPMSLLKMSCKTANFLLLEGRYITGAEHKEKPANPDKSRVYELLRSGAGGGTRTHTPLRITDFESVSSANSDTPAFIFLSLTPDGASEKSEVHRGGTLKISYILNCQISLKNQGI